MIKISFLLFSYEVSKYDDTNSSHDIDFPCTKVVFNSINIGESEHCLCCVCIDISQAVVGVLKVIG